MQECPGRWSVVGALGVGSLWERKCVKRTADTVQHYRQALTVRRDHPRPCHALARLRAKAGGIAAARRLLEDGVKASPRSKALIRALTRLEAGDD